MTRFPIPDAALTQHTAVLGKTGSGKTTTAKGIVEHLVEQGARVCILDPIKSDWWGLTSSADGKRAGLPFHILGGPRGHVPLHESSGKAIAEIVANGTLPLSIIDMADFAPGGQSKFFIDFAPTLLRKMRGVVHLVMEEAHLFAPKERSNIGDENMAIHWAKMLATAGRSKGVRLILVTQRTQALHNAMLGSCETMIAHRLTAPADQKPLINWLKANTAKDIVEKVSGSLASLKTGTAWVCSGEAKFFELVQFPRIATYDNSATPTGDMGAAEVRTAPVDVERLRAIVGDAAKEAEANDPKALRAENARLKAELAKSGASKPVEKINTPPNEAAALKDRERAFAAGVRQGREETYPEAWLAGERTGFTRGIVAAHTEMKAALGHVAAVAYVPGTPPKRIPAGPVVGIPTAVASAPSPVPRPVTQSAPRAPRSGDTGLPGPQQRIVNSLATWADMGHATPSNAQVAWLAGYSPSSTSYTNPRSALKSADLVDYPSPDRVALTPAGREIASAIEIHGTLLDFVLAQIRGPEARILKAVAAFFPNGATNDEVAEGANYSASSTSYTNPRSALRTKDLITYPSQGVVRAADWLFT